jgi:mRNA interferase MazF
VARSGGLPLGFRRPLLIISTDSFKQSYINTIIAAVITTNPRLADAPGNVRVPVRGTGLERPSVVNVSQIITVDRSFLTERLGKLNAQFLAEVENGLRLVLSL